MDADPTRSRLPQIRQPGDARGNVQEENPSGANLPRDPFQTKLFAPSCGNTRPPEKGCALTERFFALFRSPLRCAPTMIAEMAIALASGIEHRASLDVELRAALRQWESDTGHTARYWFNGYCADFAKTLAKFFGKPARLASVRASDGNVHHVVVVLGNLVIDARGVNTKESLVAAINQEAAAGSSSLMAVDVISFEREHAQLLKECSTSQLRKLKAYFNTPGMQKIRRQTRMSNLNAFSPCQRYETTHRSRRKLPIRIEVCPRVGMIPSARN